MTFAVKAQYSGAFRRLTFSSVPSFSELNEQLGRVFPSTNGDFYLSQLLLYPDASANAHVLVARQIGNEDAYVDAMAPHSRLYSNALLKLTVMDGRVPFSTSSNVPRSLSNPVAESSGSSGRSNTLPHGFISGLNSARFPSNYNQEWSPPFFAQPESRFTPSDIYIPPLPPSFSTIPVLSSMFDDLDSLSRPLPALPSQPQPESDRAPKEPSPSLRRAHSHASMTSSCCSVSEGKAEVKGLLDSFKVDLEAIMTSSFGPAETATSNIQRDWPNPPSPLPHLVPMSPSSDANSLDEDSEMPGAFTPLCLKKWCSCCQKMFSGPWYSCMLCRFVVLCGDCHHLEQRKHTEAFGENHIVTRQTCAGCPEVVQNREPFRPSQEGPFNVGRGRFHPPGPPNWPPMPYVPSHGFMGPSRASFNPGSSPFASMAPAYPAMDFISRHAVNPPTIPPPPFVPPFSDHYGASWRRVPPPAHVEVPSRASSPGSSTGSVYIPPIPEVFPWATWSPRIPDPVPSPIQPPVIHERIFCDHCNDGPIIGVRHKCLSCSNFDLCTSCMEGPGVANHDPFHDFADIKVPGDTVRMHTPRPLGPPPVIVAPVVPRPAEPVRHDGVVCDSCNFTIVGVRHKCLDCANFDLCGACIGNEGAQRHDPFHAFIDIASPGRVIVHEVRGGELQRSVSAPVAAPEPVVVVPAVHNADCDLCDSRINGDRYKCASCPDFDVCASCFAITPEQHPNHNFTRICKPEDFIKSASIRGAAVVRHFATCNGCNKTILGVRWKCMHVECPDYDLCAACEAHPISMHPEVHPMLKIKKADTVIPVLRHRLRTSTRVVSATSAIALRSRSPSPVLTVRAPTPVVAVQETTVTPIASVAPSFTLPPLDYPEDLREFWPKVANELKHLLGSATPPAEVVAPVASIPVSPPTLDSPTLGEESLLTRVDATTKFADALRARRNLADATTMHIASVTTAQDISQALSSFAAAKRAKWMIPIATVSEDVTTEVQTNGGEVILSAAAPVAVEEARVVVPGLDEPEEVDDIATTLLAFQAAPAPVVLPVLDATFVLDTTIPDGQILPPGSEFVKSWQMMNRGTADWPSTTKLVFVAGDSLTKAGCVAEKAKVGSVAVGSTFEVSTGELKAPDAPGRYVGYWRLNDGVNFFGSSIWIDITVPEVTYRSEDSDESMSSSVIMMPESGADSVKPASVGVATSKTRSDFGSDDSSMSLISIPSSESEDDWEDSRSQVVVPTPPASSPVDGAPPRSAMEYVMLYDDEVSSEEE